MVVSDEISKAGVLGRGQETIYMISIIIPALNEEKLLPILLESIKKQILGEYEVIIADAGSTDRTAEIAKAYNCKIIMGGLPAKGRNEGVKSAKGDLLLFLDADSVLPDGFYKSIEEFEKRNLDFASFGLLPYGGKKMQNLAFNVFYNWYIYALEKALPHAAMGILAKRDLFLKLNGYDETITLAEDHDLARRAKRIANYGILRSSKIYISDRRLKKDGWVKTVTKYLLCELYMVFVGPVRSDIFNYKFNHYEKK